MVKEKGARSRRFEAGLAPDAVEVNESVSFDYRLLPHDVAGSIAHAKMLAKQGIIPKEDAVQIESGLREVESELAAGALEWDPKLEDVHMNVEAHLSERIGDAGRRLHTGRSRNDQVATDMRLYARANTLSLMNLVDALRNALVTLAAKHVDDFLPGNPRLPGPIQLSAGNNVGAQALRCQNPQYGSIRVGLQGVEEARGHGRNRLPELAATRTNGLFVVCNGGRSSRRDCPIERVEIGG